MNIEDFATYEQAVALKKLGFEETCLYHYSNSGLLFSNSDSDGEGGGIYVEDLMRSYNLNNNKNYIDAPTLSQAQKWLRIKKNLYVYADGHIFDKNYEKPSYYPCVLDVISEHDEISISDMNYYNTPEEALSGGITECLKLLS